MTRPAEEIFGEHTGYGFAGRNVNVATGNYTIYAVDLSFADTTLGMTDWHRTYNSLDATRRPLGIGWATAFSARLHQRENGDVEFHGEDGRVLIFERTGDRYRRPQDLEADLARDDEGNWTLRANSGGTWSFDSSGRLTGRDGEGQRVTLTYGADDHLLRAGHSFGPALTIDYDDRGLITAVSSGDGRVVHYGHDDEGHLTSVSGPVEGAETRYAYDENGRLASGTDADGIQYVRNTYDASERVVHQDFAGGSGADFGYENRGVIRVTSVPTGAVTVFETGADGRLIAVTDANGNRGTFEYDENGRLAGSATPGGVRRTQRFDDHGNLIEQTVGGATVRYTYDSRNRIVTAADAEGMVTRYEYAGDTHVASAVVEPGGARTERVVDRGLVTRETDPDGNTTRYDYDERGSLTRVTLPDDTVIGYSYDAAGRPEELTLPSGTKNHWRYDATGQVTSHIGGDGEESTFEYSPAGRLRREVDPSGSEVRYDYDGNGYQTGVTDPMGQTTRLEYDVDGNLTTLTDPEDGRTTFEHDGSGRLMRVTDPVGTEVRYSYDADGNATGMTDPNGTTRTEYDDQGRPVAVTRPTGATTRYAYDNAGKTTGVTDPEGGQWKIEHDEAGMPVRTVDPTGAMAKHTWTKTGYLSEVVDAAGNSVKTNRDKRGQVVEMIDRNGGVTRTKNDADGRPIAVTTPAGLTNRTSYDGAGRIITQTGPQGWVTRFEYDKRGLKTAEISPSGVTTRYRHDKAGRLTSVTNGDGNPTLYGYDRAGRMISVTDAKGAVTRYAYDKAGRVVAVTDPLGRITRREYDKAGNLAKVIDADDREQRFEYDAEDRLVKQSADDGTEVSYAYDKAGRRISMTDASGTTQFGYDKAGHLISVTDPDGATTSLDYTKAGLPGKIGYPDDGPTVGYRYDANGGLIGLDDSRAGTADYALDPDGRLLTEQLPRRIARRYRYDLGRLDRFEVWRDGRPVSRTDLTRDPDGRILTQRDTDPHTSELRTFRYDRLGQLVSGRSWDMRPWPWGAHEHGGRSVHTAVEEHGFWQENRDGSLDVTYDAVGNRTAIRHGDHETHYRYDDADQLVSSWSHGHHTRFKYDALGRLVEERTGDARREIIYDGLGRPIRTAAARSGGDDAPRDEIEATYNGDGLITRLIRTRTDAAHDRERSASVRYRWSTEQIPQILSQRGDPALSDSERGFPNPFDADFSYGYGRTFVSGKHGATSFDRDVYGSMVRTDRTRWWAQADRYGPFGEPGGGHESRRDRRRRGERGGGHLTEVRGGGHHHDHDDHSEHWRSPELPRFGYRGELSLGTIVDLRARFYDSSRGRFTTRDPVTEEQTAPGVPDHPYAYVRNDPLNRTDPRGLLAGPVASGLAARAVGGALGGTTTTTQRRQEARTMIASNVSMLVRAPQWDRTWLHNRARDAARDQLLRQKYLRGQFDAARWMHTEFPIPGGGKDNRNPGDGSVDILYDRPGRLVEIWEVKSALKNPLGEFVQGAAEVMHYIGAYQRAFGRPATPGAPMLVPVPVWAAFGVLVGSPGFNPLGVIQYWKFKFELPEWLKDLLKTLGLILLLIGIAALIALLIAALLALLPAEIVLGGAAALLLLFLLLNPPDRPQPVDPRV